MAAIFGGWIDHKFGSQRGLLIAVGGTMVGLVLSLSMRPDTILFFIPYDPASPPVHGLPFFEIVAGDHLRHDRDHHRDLHHGGLRQQPHDDGAHRADGEDGGVLRALCAVGTGDGVSGAVRGGALHGVDAQHA